MSKSKGRCPSCKGTGVTRNTKGGIIFEMTCTKCKGIGVSAPSCGTCGGTGSTYQSETTVISFPPGANESSTYLKSGAGGRFDGHSGDLRINIDVIPDYFRFCLVQKALKEKEMIFFSR